MLFQYENSYRSDDERRRPDRLTNFFKIYITRILLKYSTFVCQIAQLEQLKIAHLHTKKWLQMKGEAFSQVVDHYVQRFTLNRCITKGI